MVPVSSVVLGMCNQSKTQFWSVFVYRRYLGTSLRGALCPCLQQPWLAGDDFASRSIASDAVRAAHTCEPASGESLAGQLPVF